MKPRFKYIPVIYIYIYSITPKERYIILISIGKLMIMAVSMKISLIKEIN